LRLVYRYPSECPSSNALSPRRGRGYCVSGWSLTRTGATVGGAGGLGGATVNAGVKGVWLADLPWTVVKARLDAGATAVLPVGAASKEHGPHLPMNTDCLQAEWLARRLAGHRQVLIWPTVAYGHYPAFVAYPGSCSLSRETFRAMAREILEGLLRAGAARVLVVNTGLSTIPPLAEAAARLSRPDAVTLAHVYQGDRFRSAVQEIEEQPHGSHADEIETSIMLAIAPGQVDMAKAEPWAGRAFAAGPFRPADPGSPNYSPSGIYGDPTLASREKGERLAQAMLQDLLAMLP